MVVIECEWALDYAAHGVCLELQGVRTWANATGHERYEQVTSWAVWELPTRGDSSIKRLTYLSLAERLDRVHLVPQHAGER